MLKIDNIAFFTFHLIVLGSIFSFLIANSKRSDISYTLSVPPNLYNKKQLERFFPFVSLSVSIDIFIEISRPSRRSSKEAAK